MTTQLLHPKVDPIIQARKILIDWYYKKYPSDDCFVPHLEHWLAVLHDQTGCRVTYSTYGSEDKKRWGYIQTSCLTAAQVKSHSTRIGFDVDENGQPATEADYKAFNDIVGL